MPGGLRPVERETLRSVRRLGELLNLFGPERPELGVTEAARALGVSKSSAHALLISLSEVGLLCRTPAGRYRVGRRWLSLAEAYRAGRRLSPSAQAALWKAAISLRCVVSLAVLEESSLVFVERAVPHPYTKVMVPLGVRLRLHASAAGKVLLAFRPEREAVAILRSQGELEPFTENTLTGLVPLVRELRRIRENGYAYNLGEAFPQDYCLAVPVWGESNEVVAAVSVSMSRRRFWRDRQEALAAAREVSRTISVLFSGPHG